MIYIIVLMERLMMIFLLLMEKKERTDLTVLEKKGC